MSWFSQVQTIYFKQDQEETDATHAIPEINESTDDSDSDEWYDKQCQKHGPPAKVNVGDFVTYQYEGELFPGQVTKVYSQGVRVKSFKKCAGRWTWSKQIDEIDYLPPGYKKKFSFLSLLITMEPSELKNSELKQS